MQKNTQNTPPAHLKGATHYGRASSRKDAKTSQNAQIKAAERYAQSAALSITNTFFVCCSGNTPTICKELKAAMTAAQKENNTLIVVNFARIGRNEEVLHDFVISAARQNLTWCCPNIIGSDGIEISNNSTAKELLLAYKIAANDFKNKSQNATKRVETHGTNLVTTHADRQAGAKATQAKAVVKLPPPVKQHVKTLLYTTSKSLQQIADICTQVAKTDIVFASYEPFYPNKIKRIQKVLEQENRINGV